MRGHPTSDIIYHVSWKNIVTIASLEGINVIKIAVNSNVPSKLRCFHREMLNGDADSDRA